MVRRRSCRVSLVFLSLTVFAASLGCSSGGDDDGSGNQSNVNLYTAAAAITALTGAASSIPEQIFMTSGGGNLLVDAASRSILAITSDGTPVPFTAGAVLAQLTGQPVSLGALDELLAGTLLGHFLAADTNSGNIIDINPIGIPIIFSNKVAIGMLTGQTNVKMVLPRELTNNQIIAQDTFTSHIILFDPAGNPVQIFVDGTNLANLLGVSVPSAVAAGWERSSQSQSLFARFAATNAILRLQLNGGINLHVTPAALATLFPTITDLRVLDLAYDPTSDFLVLLIGAGARGVALAQVPAGSSAVLVLSSPDQIAAGAGQTVDLSDIEFLLGGALAAVDRGGAQVLAIGTGGAAFVVGRTSDIALAAGVQAPVLSLVSGTDHGTAAIAERSSGSLLQVR